jgi:hypothetical protein
MKIDDQMPEQQIKLILKEFMMEVVAAVTISILHRGRVDLGQVIGRYARKISGLK